MTPNKGEPMSVDTFTVLELGQLSDLGAAVRQFNLEQLASQGTPLFAEVVLYRAGSDVALLTEAPGDEPGHLSLEVKVR